MRAALAPGVASPGGVVVTVCAKAAGPPETKPATARTSATTVFLIMLLAELLDGDGAAPIDDDLRLALGALLGQALRVTRVLRQVRFFLLEVQRHQRGQRLRGA